MTDTQFKHHCPDCTGAGLAHEGFRPYQQDTVMSEGIHVMFANDWGLSIQRNVATYSDDETFEVAVLHRSRAQAFNFDWSICFRSKLTDDVLGYVMGEQLVAMFQTVSGYPVIEECSHHEQRSDV